MKQLVLIITICVVSFSFSQDKKDKESILKANNHIYEANSLLEKDDFVSAEVEYRKALSKAPSASTGAYNLGNSYYKKGNYEEALFRHQQATKTAKSKEERHKAFHNMGNVLMKNENYGLAVEAYKNALRNDPTDEETRYNLALAKQKKKEQDDNKQDKDKEDKDDKNKDDKNQDKDKKEEDKENKENKEKDNKDQENKEKGDDDKKNDEDKPKDEKEDKANKADENKKDEQKPQPGQLSPQQIKSLLEAMNNQEQKVQEKMNAKKEKGVKIKTEKDW